MSGSDGWPFAAFPHSTVLAVLFEVLREYGAYVVPLYLHHLLEQQWTAFFSSSSLDWQLARQFIIRTHKSRFTYVFTYLSTRGRT